jgi:hypothetical protein
LVATASATVSIATSPGSLITNAFIAGTLSQSNLCTPYNKPAIPNGCGWSGGMVVIRSKIALSV